MSFNIYAFVSKVINKLMGGKLFTALKADFTYAQDNLITKNAAPFLSDPGFLKAYEKGRSTDRDRFLKGVDIQWRIHTLCWAASYARHLEGDFVECGVRTGVFSKSIIEFLSFEKLQKRFLLIDSFAGVVPDLLSDSEMERERPGIVADDVWQGIYQELIQQYQSIKNVSVVKGVVPEVLTSIHFEKIAFLSLDLNSALPEEKALEFLWDYLVPGGIIILDDYGYPGFELQQQVHDHFAESKNTSVLCLPTCQGIIIKPKS